MPTQLPQVTVTRTEAGNGYRIHCTTCHWTAYRHMRGTADTIAIHHQAAHTTPHWDQEDA